MRYLSPHSRTQVTSLSETTRRHVKTLVPRQWRQLHHSNRGASFAPSYALLSNCSRSSSRRCMSKRIESFLLIASVHLQGQSRKTAQEEKLPAYEASTEARLLNECLATDDRIREHSARMACLKSNNYLNDTASDQLSAQIQQSLLESTPSSSSNGRDLRAIDTPPRMKRFDLIETYTKTIAVPSFHDGSSQMASMPGRQPMQSQQQPRRRQQVSDNVPPYADAIKQLRTLILSLPPGKTLISYLVRFHKCSVRRNRTRRATNTRFLATICRARVAAVSLSSAAHKRWCSHALRRTQEAAVEHKRFNSRTVLPLPALRR